MAANPTTTGNGIKIQSIGNADIQHISPQETAIRNSDSSLTTTLQNDGASGLPSAGTRLSEVFDRRFVSGFTPMYFVTVMGTGISSAILYNFPYPSEWLRVCSYIMFGFTVFFFISTTILFVVTCIKHPRKFITFHCDPNIAPFMGAYAMGYNTIVNYIYLLTAKNWIIGVYCIWWIAVLLSIYCACIVFFFALISKHKNTSPKMEPESINAIILMPVVTLTVASSSGGLFALDLPTLSLQFSTMIISYMLWAVAVSMACMCFAVYFWRLFVYKIPPTGAVFTLFLMVGLLGQAGFGIELFGSNMYKFLTTNSEVFSLLNLTYLGSESAFAKDGGKENLALVIGSGVLFTSTMISLFLISFGYYCTFIAVFSCLSKISPFTKRANTKFAYQSDHPIKSKLNGFIRFFRAFWAMTFPLGTMTLANTEMHKVFNNMNFFRVMGAMYGALLLLITTGCILGCIYTLISDLCYVFSGNAEDDFKEQV